MHSLSYRDYNNFHLNVLRTKENSYICISIRIVAIYIFPLVNTRIKIQVGYSRNSVTNFNHSTIRLIHIVLSEMHSIAFNY